MNWKDAVPEWNRKWIVQEINCDPAIEHEPDRKTWRFHMEDFGYRQKVSFDAFFFGFSRKKFELNGRNWKTKHLFFHATSEYEFVQIKHPVRAYESSPVGDIIRSFYEKAEREWNSAIDIYSLWDFYEMIGYDHKKKCYV
jgi:hypothetical protein